MLGISEHVRPNVLLHHMVSGGLGNGPFTDFALLSVALRLHRRPHTFQVRGLYNPHTRGRVLSHKNVRADAVNCMTGSPIGFFLLSLINQVLCFSQERKKDGP